jgi:hypothetical protein
MPRRCMRSSPSPPRLRPREPSPRVRPVAMIGSGSFWDSPDGPVALLVLDGRAHRFSAARALAYVTQLVAILLPLTQSARPGRRSSPGFPSAAPSPRRRAPAHQGTWLCGAGCGVSGGSDSRAAAGGGISHGKAGGCAVRFCGRSACRRHLSRACGYASRERAKHG